MFTVRLLQLGCVVAFFWLTPNAAAQPVALSSAEWCETELGRWQTAALPEAALRHAEQQLASASKPAQQAALACLVAGLLEIEGSPAALSHWRHAIAAAPAEPYYEYRAGLHWATLRGSRAPALEAAEQHYYSALQKLELAPNSRRNTELKRKALLQLRLLYQQDGLPLLPWKGWRAGQEDVQLPAVNLRAGVFVSNDIAPSIDQSRMQRFTWEAAYANSDLRLGGTPEPLSDVQRWSIARAPTAVSTLLGTTLRQNVLGKFSLNWRSTHANQAQITSYYLPNTLNDTQQTEWSLGYERVVPLYPVLDLRLAAGYSKVKDQGYVEFLPEHEEAYDAFTLTPSLSRIIGPGRATLGALWHYADLANLTGGVDAERKRGRWTRELWLEYALSTAVAYNTFAWGAQAPYRTVSYGFAAYAGVQENRSVNGLNTEYVESGYAGVHWEGPRPLAFQLEAAAFNTRAEYVRPDDTAQADRRDPTRSFSSLRFLALPKWRVLHALPSNPSAQRLANLEIAELTLVLPVSWEFSLQSPQNYSPTDESDHGNDYAHIQAGAELWLRSLSFEPLGGGLLLNAGYDVAHFYTIDKTQHLAHLGASLGF